MMLKKQYLYQLNVHHNHTIKGAFLWWLLRKNKHCKKFCPNCNYYFKCQEDVVFENLFGGK